MIIKVTPYAKKASLELGSGRKVRTAQSRMVTNRDPAPISPSWLVPCEKQWNQFMPLEDYHQNTSMLATKPSKIWHG